MTPLSMARVSLLVLVCISYRFWYIQREVMAWPWNLGLFKVIENGTVRKFRYGFLFAWHGNYGHILYRFRDKARSWSKIVADFYRATRMCNADYAGGRCLSVRLSHAGILSTPLNISSIFIPSGSTTILIFQDQTLWQYFDGDPIKGTSNARGYEKSRFSTNILLYLIMMQVRAIITKEAE